MDLLSIFTYNVTLMESLRFCRIEYGFRLIFLFLLFWFRLLNCRLRKGENIPSFDNVMLLFQ